MSTQLIVCTLVFISPNELQSDTDTKPRKTELQMIRVHKKSEEPFSFLATTWYLLWSQ